MRYLVTVTAMMIATASSAEISNFDPQRSIDRYWQEFEDCRFHGAQEDQPSCLAMAIYGNALQDNGYCPAGVGASFHWKRCDLMTDEDRDMDR